MPPVARFVSAAALIGVALVPTAALAEPFAPCTTNAVPVGQFGPCVIGGSVLLSRVTATISGHDVGDALAMTYNGDAEPPDEAPWAVVSYPGTAFGDAVSARTPLEIGYRLTALNGLRLSMVDLALTNAAFVGFSSIVEFALHDNAGETDVVRLGWDGGTFLGDRVLHQIDNARWLDVRTRVFGTSAVLGGGGGPGLFPLATSLPDPAPVPEPATFTLGAVGLVLAWLRKREAGNG